MIARGVFAGTRMPCQLEVSNFGNPDSAAVGTSGTAVLREVLVTASALIFPDFKWGSAGSRLEMIICDSPDKTLVNAGPVPL